MKNSQESKKSYYELESDATMVAEREELITMVLKSNPDDLEEYEH